MRRHNSRVSQHGADKKNEDFSYKFLSMQYLNFILDQIVCSDSMFKLNQCHIESLLERNVSDINIQDIEKFKRMVDDAERLKYETQETGEFINYSLLEQQKCHLHQTRKITEINSSLRDVPRNMEAHERFHQEIRVAIAQNETQNQQYFGSEESQIQHNKKLGRVNKNKVASIENLEKIEGKVAGNLDLMFPMENFAKSSHKIDSKANLSVYDSSNKKLFQVETLKNQVSNEQQSQPQTHHLKQQLNKPAGSEEKRNEKTCIDKNDQSKKDGKDIADTEGKQNAKESSPEGQTKKHCKKDSISESKKKASKKKRSDKGKGPKVQKQADSKQDQPQPKKQKRIRKKQPKEPKKLKKDQDDKSAGEKSQAEKKQAQQDKIEIVLPDPSVQNEQKKILVQGSEIIVDGKNISFMKISPQSPDNISQSQKLQGKEEKASHLEGSIGEIAQSLLKQSQAQKKQSTLPKVAKKKKSTEEKKVKDLQKQQKKPSKKDENDKGMQKSSQNNDEKSGNNKKKRKNKNNKDQQQQSKKPNVMMGKQNDKQKKDDNKKAEDVSEQKNQKSNQEVQSKNQSVQQVEQSAIIVSSGQIATTFKDQGQEKNDQTLNKKDESICDDSTKEDIRRKDKFDSSLEQGSLQFVKIQKNPAVRSQVAVITEIAELEDEEVRRMMVPRKKVKLISRQGEFGDPYDTQNPNKYHINILSLQSGSENFTPSENSHRSDGRHFEQERFQDEERKQFPEKVQYHSNEQQNRSEVAEEVDSSLSA